MRSSGGGTVTRAGDWAKSIEVFCSAKFRSSVSRSLPPPHLGAVLDGVVLALDDYPAFYRDALEAIIAVLRSAETPVAKFCGWCLLDAVLKQSSNQSLKAALMDQLPEFVATILPLQPAEATEVDLFLGCLELLRSWTLLATLPTATEERLRQLLHFMSSHRPSADKDAMQKARDAAEMSRRLKSSEQSSSQVAQHATGAAAVSGAIAALYDPARMMLSCTRCGACFASAEARDVHQESHFRSRPGVAFVRLHYPSGAHFKAFVPSHYDSGLVPRMLAAPTEAARMGHYPQIFRQNAASSNQRHVTVAVENVGVRHHCVICHQLIQPRLDPDSRGNGVGPWVLPDCIRNEDGTVAHISCATADLSAE